MEHLESRQLLAVAHLFDFSDASGAAFAEGFVSSGPADQWHLSTGRGTDAGHSADDSFYFGSGETASGGGTYQDNADGTLTSPVIDLRGATSARLTFNHLLDIQPIFDRATVSAIDSLGGSTLLAQSGVQFLTTTNGFETVEIDLSNLVGNTINLSFRFTSDATITREGWYVDDIKIETLVDGVWRSQGPLAAGLGQTENLSPINYVTGAVHTVLAHPTDADTLYIGSVNGGVWKTTNATDLVPTWKNLTDGLPSQSIGALTFDAADLTHNTIYAGTGQFSSYAQFGNDLVGLYKSTNGGQSWTILNDRLVGANISGIVANGSTIVVSVNVADNFTFNNIGIFRSTNGGQTFSQISVGNGLATGLPGGVSYDLVADPINPNVLYTSVVFADLIGGANGIYKSVNGGQSWAKVSNPAMDALILSGGGGQTSNLELAVGRQNNVYAAIINNGNPVGFFRSGNAGTTWVQLDTPSTNENGNVGLNPRGGKGPQPGSNPTPEQVAGGQGNIHFSIVADPNDSNIVYVGGDRQPRSNQDTGSFPNSIGAENFSGRLFRGDASKPPGSQFVHLTHSNQLGAPGGGTASNSSPHADSREMTFDANGDLIEGDDGGIYRRVNPRSNTGDWFSINGNLKITEVHDIAYDNLSNTITSGNQDTGTTYQATTVGQTWVSLSQGDGADIVVDNVTLAAQGQSIRYTSFQNLGLFRRTVFDASGEIVSHSFPTLNGFGGDAVFRTPVELNAIDPNRMVIQGATQIYESTDQANSVNGLGVAPNRSIFQNAIAYGGRKGGIDNTSALWVGSGSDVFFRSTFAAPLIPTPSDPTSDLVQDLAIDPEDWAEAFIVDINSVFTTNDEGVTWTDITGNLLTMATKIYSISYVKSAVDAVVVGTNLGVFSSLITSLGTWVELGADLPHVPVFDMEYDATDDVLVIGTMGRGAWTLPNVSGLLSPVAGVTNVTVDLSGNLVITDGSGNHSDHIQIASDTTNNQFVIIGLSQTITSNVLGATGSGTDLVTIPFTSVTGPSIFINTLGGVDSVTIDLDGGNFTKQVVYNGGNPASDNQNLLSLIGATSLPDVVYGFTGPGSGTIDISNNARITYSALEPVFSSVETRSVTLNYTDNAGTITVVPHGSDLKDIAVGSGAAEGITFPVPAVALTINGGSNNDIRMIGAIELVGADLTIIGKDISLQGAAVINRGDGTIHVTAAEDVSISNNSRLQTDDGNIHVQANLSNVSSQIGDAHGILLDRGQVSSINGDIFLAGRGAVDPSGSFNVGIRLTDTSKVFTTGTGANAGNITLIGTGGSTPSSNHGIQIAGDSSGISSVDGDIRLAGIGGGPATDSAGIIFLGGSVQATGDGDITFTATGLGVDDLVAANGGPGFGVNRIGSSIGTGNIAFHVDTLDLTNVQSVTGIGDLRIQPRTSSTTIGIGSATGMLNLTDAEIALFANGFRRIIIGDETSGTGAVLVNTATFNDPVTIVGGSIDLNVLSAGANDVLLTSRVDSITNLTPSGVDVTGSKTTLMGRVQPAALQPGILQVNGNLELASDASFVVQIGGTLPGVNPNNHDQLNVQGAVTINTAAVLSLVGLVGYVPAVSDQIVIINNDGIDPVVGTFAGMPDGFIIPDFMSSGFSALLEYAGGDGNDVALTVIPNVRLSVAPASMPETFGFVNVVAALSDVFTRDVIVDLSFSGQAIFGTDYTVSSTQITIVAGTSSGSTQITSISDLTIENTESIVIDVSNVSGGQELGIQSVTASITDDDFLRPQITTTLSSPTNAVPVPITVNFGDVVTGFILNDLQVSGGNASNLSDLGNGVFLLDLFPAADGTITINIPASAANDAAGKPTLAANPLSIRVDRTAPVPLITGPASPTSSDPLILTVNFGESVIGFATNDISVSNGAVTSFISLGSGSFRIVVDAIADGPVTVDIPANAARDFAFNQSVVATTYSTVVDTTGPLPILSGPASPTSGTPIQVVINFGETVVSFDPTDLTIVNGTVSQLANNGSGQFTATIQPSIDGPVSVNIAAGVLTDALGNANRPSAIFSTVVDTTPPTPVLTGTSSPTNSNPFTVDINFNEPVNDFALNDISVTNGTAAAFTDQGNGRFTVSVTAASDGPVQVQVNANVATDVAGNLNQAANAFNVTVDTTRPTVLLTGPLTITRTTPVPVRIQFSEFVNNFVAGDINVTNGTVQNLVSAGTGEFIANISPTTNGQISVTVPANVASDVTGNLNLAGTTYSIIVDTTPPVITAPSNLNVEADTVSGASRTGSAIIAFLNSATATDNIASSVTITNNAPAIFPLGLTTVTFAAVDSVGNQSSASALVVVTDTTPPQLVPPADITVEADGRNSIGVGGAGSGHPAIINFLAAAGASDIADASPATTHNAPSFFPLGTTVVTFIATDASNNSVSRTSVITVVDTTPPALTVPTGISVEGTTAGGAPVTLSEIQNFLASATATDVVDPNPTITSVTPQILPVGDTVVTFRAVDGSGNPTISTAIVRVVDTTAPTLTTPNSIQVQAESGNGTSSSNSAIAAFLLAASASDIVDTLVTITNNAPSVFPIGDTGVTFRAVDDSGNVTSRTVTVRVEDTAPPQLIPPANITVQGNTRDGALATTPLIRTFLAGAVATDNVDLLPTITNNAPSQFPLGVTVVTFTATDSRQNVRNATASITVVDTVAPTLIAPTTFTIEANSIGGADSSNQERATLINSVTAQDVVDAGPAITNTIQAFLTLGTTSVEFTARDRSNNATSAIVTLVVRDTTAPILTAPADIQVLANAPGGVARTVPQIATFLAAATATDVADSAPTITNNAPAVLPIGNTVVTFTARDASGNSSTATAMIIVSDLDSPTIVVPSTIVVEGNVIGGTTIENPAIEAFLAAATATDLVDGPLTVTHDGLDPFFPIGETIVTFRAHDRAGNEVSETSSIRVVDTTPPTITGANNLTVTADSVSGATRNLAALAQFLNNVTATDIVEQFPLITNNAPNLFPLGQTRVLFTATDASGNERRSSATVTVTPRVQFDFGDAPNASQSGFASSYPVTIAQNGARHAIGSLFLGTGIDPESDGQPDASAGLGRIGGDDNTGTDDEDGVTSLASIFVSATSETRSSFRVVASAAAKLEGWIDFNRDGDWIDAQEKIFNGVQLQAGENILTFTIPLGTSVGQTGARFRLSTSGGLSPAGEASDGEVEDYLVVLETANQPSSAVVNVVSNQILFQRVAGDDVVGTSGSREIFRAPSTGLRNFTARGSSGDDTVTLDFNSGLVIPIGGVTLAGSGGSNLLVFVGSPGVFDLTSPAINVTNFNRISVSPNTAATFVVDRSAIERLAPGAQVTFSGSEGINLFVKDPTNWRMSTPIIVNGTLFRVATHEVSGVVIRLASTNFYRNFIRPGDVNNDGFLTSGDALPIIFELNERLISNPITGKLSSLISIENFDGNYLDRSGDGNVTALDALIVINDLFVQDFVAPGIPSASGGEGEHSALLGTRASDTPNTTVDEWFVHALSPDESGSVIVSVSADSPRLLAGRVNDTPVQSTNNDSVRAVDALLCDEDFLETLGGRS